MLLISHDRALLDAVADRTLAIEDGALRSYDGGWADLVRARSEQAMPRGQTPREQPKQKREKSVQPARPPRRPAELERLEAEIAAQEEAASELERRLADDWSDVDAVSEYRRARSELETLLSRWESLFEQAQLEAPRGSN